MRAYEQTHAWIDFRFDTHRITPVMWLRLGEAQAKCENISGVPLMPAVADEMHSVFLAKGVLATTAIEGNTLTENEVRRRIDKNLKLPPSKEYLGKEVDNILAAIEVIIERIMHDAPTKLRPDDIMEFNRMVLNDLPHEEEVIAGRYRNHEVWVGGVYKGVPSEDVPYLVGRLCDWLNGEFNITGELKIVYGILKAIVAHVYLAWIHPFGDGNGRTARLVELQVLLSVGVPTPAAHLLSNYYNQTRSEYYRYLDMASKREDGIYYFIDYALRGFVDSLEEQIRLIEAQQLMVHWQSYVHENFRNRDSKADIRRRRLVLDLSLVEQNNFVPTNDLRHISPRIAEAYAGKTDKTVQRDVNALLQMGLVQKTKEGVRARIEIMRAFLPQKRD